MVTRSPTIPRIITHHAKERTVTDHSHDAHHSITIPTRVSDPKYSQTPSQEWSPTIPKMVTYHPKDSYSPLQGWSPTIPRMGKPQCHDKPPSHGLSPTITRRVTHHPPDSPLLSPGWSPTNSRTVIHHPEDGHPTSQVTHLPLGVQPPYPGEFPAIQRMIL